MPELPEVTTVINTLKPLIIGKTIQKIEVYRPKNILSDLKEFETVLLKKTIVDIKRKGKFLFFYFSEDYTMIAHLRMEGKYFFHKKQEERNKHDILSFLFSDGTELVYNDVRKFGIVYLTKNEKVQEAPVLKNLGPEPWEITFEEFYEKLKKSHAPLKEALLDQSIMSGLGNIYADETLFASRLHPLYQAKEVTKEEANIILKEARRILEEAIREGGSTIRSYHPSEGVDGRMQSRLEVYGHAHEPCPRCAFPLRKISVGGRGTTYCPRCQTLPTEPLTIAITGPIASGKSAVARFLKNKGYRLIDADQIVKELYQDETIIELLKNWDSSLIKDEKIDRDYLRNLVLNDQEKLKELNALIHPLVYQRMLDDRKASPLPCVFDIPVFFYSPLEEVSDLIIYVDAPEEIRKKRLLARHKSQDIELNKPLTKGFLKRKGALIIDGSQSLESLEERLNELTFL